jgi:hypothetical protein
MLYDTTLLTTVNSHFIFFTTKESIKIRIIYCFNPNHIIRNKILCRRNNHKPKMDAHY